MTNECLCNLTFPVIIYDQSKVMLSQFIMKSKNIAKLFSSVANIIHVSSLCSQIYN